MKTEDDKEFNLASLKTDSPGISFFARLFELKSLFGLGDLRGKSVFKVLAHRIADMANFFHGLYKQTENAV
jgi:hypothetical protein